MGKWYYRKDDQRFGPCTSEEIRHLVAVGILNEDDTVWPDPGEEGHGICVRDAVRSLEEPESAGGVPDWLEDVALLQALRSAPEPPAREPPEWLEDLRIWYGTEAAPPPTTTPPPVPEPSPVEQAVEDTGFDPRTGRVTDPERFARWRREQANVPAIGVVSNGSVMEAFRTARIALERWIDDEKNRSRIVNDRVDQLLRHPEVERILKAADGHGAVMREKLRSHMIFLLENRKKFHASRR